MGRAPWSVLQTDVLLQCAPWHTPPCDPAPPRPAPPALPRSVPADVSTGSRLHPRSVGELEEEGEEEGLGVSESEASEWEPDSRDTSQHGPAGAGAWPIGRGPH